MRMHSAEAFYYTYPGFVDIFHVMQRNRERFGYSLSLIMCTVENVYSDALEASIRNSAEKGEAYTKYSDSQYLMLVMGNEELCNLRCQSIDETINTLTQGQAHVRYEHMSVS